ncbi:hypothetical protein ACH5RR_027148 [Cinchona calisaya]|uniref:CASP-like protein n=1 Tax=Cinchona calisaya TaxID=153742 RepID=A0ABD2Z4N1_9GENT
MLGVFDSRLLYALVDFCFGQEGVEKLSVLLRALSELILAAVVLFVSMWLTTEKESFDAMVIITWAMLGVKDEFHCTDYFIAANLAMAATQTVGMFQLLKKFVLETGAVAAIRQLANISGTGPYGAMHAC